MFLLAKALPLSLCGEQKLIESAAGRWSHRLNFKLVVDLAICKIHSYVRHDTVSDSNVGSGSAGRTCYFEVISRTEL